MSYYTQHSDSMPNADTMMSNYGGRRGRMQTPGPPIIKSVSRESDDESPEPSPVGPPEPQAQQQQNLSMGAGLLVPPWTPQMAGADTDDQQELHHKYPALDDESLPSVPDAPPPYSPPPSSLFSGEEFPAKSSRKPIPEQVRFHKNGAPLNDLSLNHHHNPQQNQSSFGTPKDLNRSQLLPSVLYLKKDLHESHQSVFLLRQENKALVAECDRFQNELAKWQQWQRQQEATASEKEQSLLQQIAQLQQRNADLTQRHEQAEQQRQTVEQQMEAQRRSEQEKLAQEKNHAKQQLFQAKQDAEKLSQELLTNQATVIRLETAQSQARAEQETLRAELRDVRARMKDQSHAVALKMKATNEEHEQTVAKLQKELDSARLEIDRLKAMHLEAEQKFAKNAAELDANVQADILRFQTVADEANAEMEEMRQQLTELESEFTEKECILQDEVDRLKTELAKTTVQDAQRQKNQLESENRVKGIQEALADATERENELLSEKDALEKKLATAKEELQQEVGSLQQALAKSLAEKESLQSSLTKKNEALKESYSKYKTLRAENNKLQKELVQQKSSPSILRGGSTVKSPPSDPKLLEDIDRLHVALSKANAKCNELRAERSSLAKELAQLKQNMRNDERSTFHPRGSLGGEDMTVAAANGGADDLIPNRLGRMRDATERAMLVKEYRRELSRLKSEHEAEIKSLTASHDQDLKDVFEEAKSELSARAREDRRRMQSEYENKVATVERRYQAELARMQRECDKNTAVAEEAMTAASAELATITAQLDKETADREALEGTVRDLERKLVIESEKSKLSVEWMKSRKQWQKETNNLLVSIQEECNAVFVQNMVPVSATPRRSSVETNNGNGRNVEHSPLSLLSVGNANDSSSVLDTSNISNIENANPDDPVPTPWSSKGVPFAGFRTSYNSPLDVTQAVDETEALVRSLLEN